MKMASTPLLNVSPKMCAVPIRFDGFQFLNLFAFNVNDLVFLH